MTINLYAAPLEGLTTQVWRKAHREVFGGADKYFTPFISPNKNLTLIEKELREISANEDDLVPQVLTNNEEQFDWICKTLKDFGYSEINLNLGCPSGTVTAKGKGAGALCDIDALDRFLDSAYSIVDSNNMLLSIKTRVGFEDSENWNEVLKVYEKYPVHELIIHPRVRAQFYKGKPDRNLFLDTLASTNLKVVYNGDVTDVNDDALDYGCDVMVGRGILARPALFREIKGGGSATRDELRRFHGLVLDGYSEYMPGVTPLLHRMKEFWSYFGEGIGADTKSLKRLVKAKRLEDYNAAVEAILEK